MSVTFPIKKIIRFKVPGVLALGLVVGQFIVSEIQSNTNPNCTLVIEKPHISTSLKETRGIRAIKLNITSMCNTPQSFTTLNADLQTINQDSQITAYDFGQVTADASQSDPRKAKFLELFVVCQSNKKTLYLGRATGNVHFGNGKSVPVSSTSDKFIDVDCEIGAK